MPELTKAEIEQKKKERASAKRLMIDRLRFWVGVVAITSIMILCGVLVGSAYYLKSESLAVVTGLVSTVTIGLINLLNGMVVPAPPEDPLAIVAKDLVHHLQENNKSAEIIMDKNMVKIGQDGSSKIVTSNDKDLMWGDDKK